MKKRFLACIVSVMLLISACAKPQPAVAPESTPTELSGNAELNALRNAWGTPYSYTIELCCQDYLYQAFSRTVVKEYALDHSFHFIVTDRHWNYSDYDKTQVREYYYRYEGNTYVCYIKSPGQEPTRIEMSPQDKATVDATEEYVTGVPGLLPEYLEDFTALGTDAQSGLAGYRYRLPVAKVLPGNDTMINVLANYAVDLEHSTYSEDLDLDLICTAWVEPASLRPIRLEVDFSELKPYVLSDGAISAEYALELGELMYVTFTFDHTVRDSVAIPEEFFHP
ncbi:MAG: hypothetical protein E7437_06795 [Ruminococcaceae bacterium]|nr:hypothetical protein [Oscillospiraceae bacterium]